MSGMDYDKLAAPVPLNRTAAMVLSAKGEHWAPKAKMAGLVKDPRRWFLCCPAPPTIPVRNSAG